MRFRSQATRCCTFFSGFRRARDSSANRAQIHQRLQSSRENRLYVYLCEYMWRMLHRTVVVVVDVVEPYQPAYKHTYIHTYMYMNTSATSRKCRDKYDLMILHCVRVRTTANIMCLLARMRFDSHRSHGWLSGWLPTALGLSIWRAAQTNWRCCSMQTMRRAAHRVDACAYIISIERRTNRLRTARTLFTYAIQ